MESESFQITITDQDYKNYYLHSYYFSGKLTKTIYRIGMPFLIIWMGYDFYGSGDRFNIGLGGFGIGFGIYYLLYPFINALFLRSPTVTFSFRIENEKILIVEPNGESNYNLIAYPLKRNRNYYFIRFKDNIALIFPIHRLSDRAVEVFDHIVAQQKMELDLHQ